MNKYYPFKSKEELLNTIDYLKRKLDKATTHFDKLYLKLRIETLGKMLDEN